MTHLMYFNSSSVFEKKSTATQNIFSENIILGNKVYLNPQIDRYLKFNWFNTNKWNKELLINLIKGFIVSYIHFVILK